MKGAATILLLLILHNSFSQINITLSSRHQNRLTEIKSGHKRAKHFYRYFKKDSLRQLRRLNRQARKSWDSLSRAARNQRNTLREIQSPNPEKTLDSINAQISSCRAILNNPVSPDSLREVAKRKARGLTFIKLRYLPNFATLENAFLNLPDSASWKDMANPMPGLDSIDVLFSNPGELLDFAAKNSESQFSAIPSLGNGTPLTEGLAEFQELNNRIKEPKMDAASADSLLNRKVVLETVVQKLGHLFSKYSSFSNSADLSDATSRSSLQGKSFYERITLGGNVNVISTDPFCMDFSPQLGFRITSRFVVGLGVNYRISFGDSIQYKGWSVSTTNRAIHAFASYAFLTSWYGYSEVQLSAASFSESEAKWKGNYFVGLGKKFLVHPKMYMTLTLLYNLNPDNQNQIYPQRFQLRLGFQTSDLAFRKKRMNFDPNR
ncbi:MAG: hypothetical protein JNL40_06370 [Cyclobacteriaceae bacterium]|nr:hypothetical protein [Cyclobacteriaceae bacterium]